MNFVLDIPDLVELIASKMKYDDLCHFRLVNKRIRSYSKIEFMKMSITRYKEIAAEYVEHAKFQYKRLNAATSDMLTVFYETELDNFLSNLNHAHKSYDVFYNDVLTDQNIYEIMLINSESEEDFVEQVKLLHKDFLENFVQYLDLEN
jgi:hypothetical protein